MESSDSPRFARHARTAPTDASRRSRRAFLAGIAGTAGVGLAGCLGDNDGSSGEQADGQPLPTPVLGGENAAVTVRVYEDFACGGCAYYHQRVYPQVYESFIDSGEIRYEFYDFPLPVDPTASWEAASAARAVQDEAGVEAFWRYAGGLFANQQSLGPDAYEALAEELDVDGAQVREAAENESYRETVEAARGRGEELSIEATPSVTVDGELLQWEQIAYEPLREAISAALDDTAE